MPVRLPRGLARLAGTICLGLLALADSSVDHRRPVSTLRSELFTAMRSARLVEGRLTGFPFAPYRPLGGRQIGMRVGTAGRRHPQDLGDLAVVQLLHGKQDQAVGLLEKAT